MIAIRNQEQLATHHRAEWEASGVNHSIIERNVWTIHDPAEVDRLLNRNTDRRWKHSSDLVPGWAVAGVDPLTGEHTLKGAQYKPDTPRPQLDSDGNPKLDSDGNPKYRKYETPVDEPTAPLFLDMGSDFWLRIHQDPGHPFIITEGAKKAAAALSMGYPAVSIPGVSTGQLLGRLKPELAAFCPVGRTVYLAFDSDILTKASVRRALDKLGRLIAAAGALVRVCQLPETTKGLDDYLAAGGKIETLLHQSLTFEEWREQVPDEERPETEEPCRLARRFRLVEGRVGDRLRFNTLKQQVELDQTPIDADDLQLQLALQFNLSIPEGECIKICSALARRNRYNPIQQYLDAVAQQYPADSDLLDSLSGTYLGTSEPLHQAYLRKALLSAVARAYQPGCKVDNVLILQGAQGTGKSSFFRVLATSPDWFDDSLGSVSDKDERMKLHQAWFVEWAELEAIFRRRDIASVKAFITCQRDFIRLPYRRSVEAFDRPSIIVGSTNQEEFLGDTTGNRRFWVCPVRQSIPLEQLRAERDRIWAAAVHAYRSGESWLLPAELREQSAQEAAEFEISDPWSEVVLDYIDKLPQVTVAEVLQHAIGVPLERQDRAAQMRVTSILKMGGCHPARVKKAGRQLRIWKNPKFEYFREEDGNVVTPDQNPDYGKDLGGDNLGDNLPQGDNLLAARLSPAPVTTSGGDNGDNGDNLLSKLEKNDFSETDEPIALDDIVVIGTGRYEGLTAVVTSIEGDRATVHRKGWAIHKAYPLADLRRSRCQFAKGDCVKNPAGHIGYVERVVGDRVYCTMGKDLRDDYPAHLLTLVHRGER